MWTEREAEEAGRIFTRHMKLECWRRAAVVPGRDPDRWRLDAAGNVVSALLRGCLGCLCHEYDHIVPFSRGGSTTADNCQVLQTRVNRIKGNDADDPARQRLYSCAKTWTEQNLDDMEVALYGDVKRDGLHCRCKSLVEFEEAAVLFRIPKKANGVAGCTDWNLAGSGHVHLS